MSENNKSYRVKANINEDKFVSVGISQDFSAIDLLSLKIDTSNFYKLHTSNYGCIAGRVLANGGVGVPNAKVSVFVQAYSEDGEDPVISELYPFTTSFSNNSNGTRYNLFPDTQVTVCHTPIGTFPSKRETLDDETITHVFNRYYTYTTRTNNAGDYMIFGLPVGDNVIHTDIDLSDIGFLSQKPRDMVYKGYGSDQFESMSKFKSDTNINNLSQVITQDTNVYVYPFWGSEEEGEIKITRNDINIQYKFEPTCVFIGSLVTDERSNGVQKNCVPTERMGKMDRLTTGLGTIEMIRKKPDGSVESYSVKGNQLIDGNGTWCYQIPMNLDYYMTDEYGNFVPSDDTEKGIPTRTRVRFRVSLTDFHSDYENNHLSKLLIPNNPKEYKDLDYRFGSYTIDDEEGTKSFRDLLWNKVYTVKSYIPRIQNSVSNKERRFTGFKEVNVPEGNNPIPYNNMRVRISFNFALQCAILKILIKITEFVNKINTSSMSKRKCTVLGDGICPDLENWYFAPGCPNDKLSTTLDIIKQEVDSESTDSINRKDSSEGENFCVTNTTKYLMQCVEINLAMEHNVIQFDFYNDWINGMVYVPRWFVNIKKKHSYFFGTFRTKAKVEACKEDTFKLTRNFVQQCAVTYGLETAKNKYYTSITSPIGCKNNYKQVCHGGYGRKSVRVFGGKGGGGLVHTEETMLGENVYYFKPAEWLNVSNDMYGTRCLMFATDIVLLGSLDEYDKDGIPMAFKELVSSTYIMPTNLASTNMGKEGYMYGTDGNGTSCSGRKYLKGEPMTILKDTFENYKMWSKNTDYYQDEAFDENENPITESSGIDWGYSGPGQRDNVNPFDISNLYFPGGHFLSISCFNAMTNIKSCVNLSRICEIGSEISQRRTIASVEPLTSGEKVKYDHIVPNGLINNNDINDSSFRKMFATMNANGLRTKVNKKTFYREYDLVPMYPNGFNGELKQYVSENSLYNSHVMKEMGLIGDSDAYMTVNEETNPDYYCFRLGLNESDYDTDEAFKAAARKHYLYREGRNVALPMYENSFYFYFGIVGGNTALDRFYKEIYGECPAEGVNDPLVVINTEDEHFCHSGDHYGNVSVVINNAESPFSIMLKRTDKSGDDHQCYLKIKGGSIPGYVDSTEEEGEEGYQSVLAHNYTKFTINGLVTGEYILSISNSEFGTNEQPFSIGETIGVGSDLYYVHVEFENFNDDYQGGNDMSVLVNVNAEEMEQRGGYIKISHVTSDIFSMIDGIVVYTNDYYMLIPTNEGHTVADLRRVISDNNYIEIESMIGEIPFNVNEWKIDEVDETSFTYMVPAWRGNDDYKVGIVMTCGIDSRNKFYEHSYSFITMPTKVDFVIGDSDLSFNDTLTKITGSDITISTHQLFDVVPYYYPQYAITDKWVGLLLKGGTINGVTITPKHIWNVKMSLYYRESMFDNEQNGNIIVYPQGGSPRYSEYKQSKTETLIYDGYMSCEATDYTSIEHRWLDNIDTKSLGASDNLEADQVRDMNAFYLPTSTLSNSGATPTVRSFTYKDIPCLDKYGAVMVDYETGYVYPNSTAALYGKSIEYNNYRIPYCVYFQTIPEYMYHVKDAKNDMTDMIFLPSIYKPFYFNFLLLVIDEKPYFRFSITNPILYNGKIGAIKINGVEYPNDNKEYPENQTLIGVTSNYLKEFEHKDHLICDIPSDYSGEDVLSLETAARMRRIIADKSIDASGSATWFRASFEVSDGIPSTYGGNINLLTRYESEKCVMPTPKNGSFSSGVRFYIPDTNDYYFVLDFLTKVMTGHGEYNGSKIVNNAGVSHNYEVYNEMNYPNIWNGIFGGMLMDYDVDETKRDISFKDVTDEIRNAVTNPDVSSMNLTAWDRFARKAREFSDKNGRLMLFAIYDPWTRSDYELPKNFSSENYISMYETVTPHKNIMSIVKVYQNDELYKPSEEAPIVVQGAGGGWFGGTRKDVKFYMNNELIPQDAINSLIESISTEDKSPTILHLYWMVDNGLSGMSYELMNGMTEYWYYYNGNRLDSYTIEWYLTEGNIDEEHFRILLDSEYNGTKYKFMTAELTESTGRGGAFGSGGSRTSN